MKPDHHEHQAEGIQFEAKARYPNSSNTMPGWDGLLEFARYLTRLIELPPLVLHKLVHFVHQIYNQLLGFPYYEPRFMREEIESKLVDVPREELKIYYSYSRRPVVVAVLVALVHWFSMGKNVIYIIRSSTLVDLAHPSNSLKQVHLASSSRSETFTQFSCLVTNCTRLSPEASPGGRLQFARDLGLLPMFAICMPDLRPFWNPLIFLQAFGLIASSAFALFVFVTTNLVPIWPHFVSMTAGPLLNGLCPRIGRQLALRRVRNELENLMRTQINHYIFHLPQHLMLACRRVTYERVAQMPLVSAPLIPPGGFDTRPVALLNEVLGEERKALERLHLLRVELKSFQEQDEKFALKVAGKKFAAYSAGSRRSLCYARAPPWNPDQIFRVFSPEGGGFFAQNLNRTNQKLALAVEHECDSFIDDCLPMTATSWFHNLWAQVFILASSCIIATAAASLMSAFQLVLDPSYKRAYDLYANQTRLDRCHLWRLNDECRQAIDWARVSSNQTEAETHSTTTLTSCRLSPVELDSLDFERWTLLQMVEIFLFMSIPTFILVVSMVHFYLSTNMFQLLIADLRTQLMTLIELGELLDWCRLLGGKTKRTCGLRETHGLSGPGEAKLRRQDFINQRLAHLIAVSARVSNCRGGIRPRSSPMRQIRDKFYEQNERLLIFFVHHRLRRANGLASRTKFEERVAFQELALLLLHGQSSRGGQSEGDNQRVARELFLSLLERVHVNYRLFMGMFRPYHEPVTVCMFFSYLLNYGFAIIGLYWFRTFSSFSALSLILVAMVLFVANVLVVFCSRVHASASKLQPHFWSLIRLMAHAKDKRTRHMRHVWLKQLDLINTAGGIALRMFNRFNITYMAIIQSVIWTSSIVLFTYTRKGF